MTLRSEWFQDPGIYIDAIRHWEVQLIPNLLVVSNPFIVMNDETSMIRELFQLEVSICNKSELIDNEILARMKQDLIAT